MLFAIISGQYFICHTFCLVHHLKRMNEMSTEIQDKNSMLVINLISIIVLVVLFQHIEFAELFALDLYPALRLAAGFIV